VRGAIAIKAQNYQQQLKEGKGGDLPFDKVYQCNIGEQQRHPPLLACHEPQLFLPVSH
jgi:hypothetical protein